jgi:putative redox protein
MKKAEEKDLKEIVARRIDLFKKRPDAALYRPRVSSMHVKDHYTETAVRGHLVKADYPGPAGGGDLAPNPVELLLASFAACIESAFYEFAVHEGLAVNSISVEIEGTLDLRGLFMIDDIQAGFKDLAYHFVVESPDDEGKIRDLAERVIAHCPVVDSLVKPTPVSGTIDIRKS